MEVVESLAVNHVPVTGVETSNGGMRNSEVVDILGNGLVTKKVIEKGLGQDSRPNYGDSVVVSYKGWLEDGSLVEEAENLVIVIGDGECIHAFDLALPLAELKELFELKTDSRFAYGDLGKEPLIPSKAQLIYHVKLEKCGDPPCYEKMPMEQRFQVSDKKRERGNFYFRRNEFQFALTCYTKAVEILMKKSEESVALHTESFPPCTPAQVLELEIKLRNNVAATQLKLEAFAAAAKTCDMVLHLDPTNRKALYRKGQALVGSSDLPEAIVVFEEALRLNPSSALLKNELQKTKVAWRKQRERQVRALSRAFKSDGVRTGKKSSLYSKLKGIWSQYKLAISAVVVASLSVTIGATLHFSERS